MNFFVIITVMLLAPNAMGMDTSVSRTPWVGTSLAGLSFAQTGILTGDLETTDDHLKSDPHGACSPTLLHAFFQAHKEHLTIPLHFAAAYGNGETMERVVRHLKKPEDIDILLPPVSDTCWPSPSSLRTALSIAVTHVTPSAPSIVKILLRCWADMRFTPSTQTLKDFYPSSSWRSPLDHLKINYLNTINSLELQRKKECLFYYQSDLAEDMSAEAYKKRAYILKELLLLFRDRRNLVRNCVLLRSGLTVLPIETCDHIISFCIPKKLDEVKHIAQPLGICDLPQLMVNGAIKRHIDVHYNQ